MHHRRLLAHIAENDTILLCIHTFVTGAPLKATFSGSFKSLASRIALSAPCGCAAGYLSVSLAQSVACPIEGDPFILSIVDSNPVVSASELVEARAWMSIGA